MEFFCRGCGRQASSQTRFFMTNCYHLLCLECTKKNIVGRSADSEGSYFVNCPVEQKHRKVLPVEKLPLEGRAMFRDIGKMLIDLNNMAKLCSRRESEYLELIQHMHVLIVNMRKENKRLRERLAKFKEGISCQDCGHQTFYGSVCSQDSIGSRTSGLLLSSKHSGGKRSVGNSTAKSSLRYRIGDSSAGRQEKDIFSKIRPIWAYTNGSR